jgi:hypothetical protein
MSLIFSPKYALLVQIGWKKHFTQKQGWNDELLILMQLQLTFELILT